jgi:thiamine-phosphate pyrophosphorylase
MESSAESCRLYLVSPPYIDHPTIFAEELRAAFAGGDVAAFLLGLAAADGASITRVADTLRPICQQRDVAFMLADRADLAIRLDADGVQVGVEAYAEARRVVGRDRQVGVVCPSSRHLAMEAADAGADYVAFDAADRELIEWWSGLFEIPCVAIGDIAIDNARPLVAAGADFLAVGSGIWNHNEGPEAAVRAFNELFA